jgi:peptidoglycan/xylan/chitin deacetylase (PgdA/CDA1 family)
VPFRTIRSSARTAIHRLGIVHAVRALKRRGCRILAYHRFPPDHSLLTAQCQHIRRHYHPVSMRQVADSLAGRSPLPDHALAVTVDDGYRDFLLHAQPVFSQFEIPVTVFLVTAFTDQELWLWWDQITYMFTLTQRTAISFDGREIRIPADRVRLAGNVAHALKRLPNAERIAQMKELHQLLEVDLPKSAPAGFEPLTWDEVRCLAAMGVEFGSHSRTHPILSRLADPEELRMEVAGSKQRLDQELGFPSLHFAYPNGTHADYDDRTLAAVKQSGFATAVTAENGFNYAHPAPHELLRVNLDTTTQGNRFVEKLAGLRK